MNGYEREVAIIDADGILRDVIPANEGDCQTDISRHRIELPANHDLHGSIGKVRWLFIRDEWWPIQPAPTHQGGKIVRISGKDIVSENTIKASRSLLITASTVLFIIWFEVPVEDLKIFDVSIPQPLVETVALYVLVYGMYNLSIHWGADVVSFRLWYQDQGVTTISGNIHTQLVEVSVALGMLISKIGHSSPYDHVKADVEYIKSLLHKAGTKFKVISAYGRFMLVAHYFLLPFCVSIYDLWLLSQRLL
jgi:hypothetical protein